MGVNQPNTIKYAMVKKLSKIPCLKKNHIFFAKIEVINNKLKQMIPQHKNVVENPYISEKCPTNGEISMPVTAINKLRKERIVPRFVSSILYEILLMLIKLAQQT